MAAPVVVQHSNATNNTGDFEFANVSSVAMTFGSLPSAGAMIIVTIEWGTAGGQTTLAGFSIADNQGVGNSYTLQTPDAGNDHKAAIYAAFNIGATSGTFTITVTTPANTYGWGKATEVTIGGGGALDKHHEATGTSTTPDSGATAATTVADEIIFSAWGTAQNTSGSDGAGTNEGYTELFNGNAFSGEHGGGSYKIVSATGAQQHTWGAMMSNAWTAVIATFSATGGGGPTFYKFRKDMRGGVYSATHGTGRGHA